MQSSEDKDVSPHSDKEDDIMDTQHMMDQQYRLSTFCTVVHRFTQGPSGLQQNEAPHITKDSNSLSTLMVFFLEIMQMLVEETNRYHHKYLDTLNEEQCTLPDWTT
jgi:hypothetical protein